MIIKANAQGVVSAKAIKHSGSGSSVLLAVAGQEDELTGMVTADVIGWHKWNPERLPALQTVLDIRCKQASTSVSFAETTNPVTGEVTTSEFTWLTFEQA